MNDFTAAADLLRQQAAGNPFARAAEQLKAQQAGRIGMSIAYDDRDPDAAAKSLAVSRELGVPSLVVDDEPEAYDAQLRMKRAAEALRSAPKTAAWLSDMGNGVLAKDDLDNLTWFERNTGPVGRALGRGARRILLIEEQGSADTNARVLADVGKTLDDIYKEEIARFGANPPYVVQADARRAAQLRFDLASNLNADDITRIIRSGSDALMRAKERTDQIAAVPMSETATRFRDGVLSESENTLMGVLSAFASDPLGGAAFTAETATEFVPAMIAASAVTAATRSPGVGAAVMGMASGLTENASSAMELLNEMGVKLETPEDAAAVLQNAEIMKAARERGLSRGLVIGMMDAIFGGVAGKQLAKSPIGDMIAQGIAQIGFGAGGEAAGQIAAGQQVSWKDIVIEGLTEFATAPIEILGVGGRRVLRETIDAETAGKTATMLADVDTQAMVSKLRERAPDKFKEALDAQGLGDKAVYVPADALREYFQAKDMALDDATATAWGIDPIAFEEAAQSGNDVAIPMSNYATYIAGTDAAQWFAENATSDPDEMSIATAKAFNDAVQDVMQEAFYEAERARLDMEEARAADVQIYDQMFSELRAAGRSPDVAQREAQVWTAFWRTMGERYGDDPLSLARSMGVKVLGPQSPEFRRRDQLDIALNTLRTKGEKALKPRGLSLAEFVKAKGGVQDAGGDVAAMDAPKGVVAETAAEMKARASQPSLGGVMPAEGRGLSLDEMGRLAAEAGYFPDLMGEVNLGTKGEASDFAARLLEALGDDVAGRKVYAEGEGPDANLQALSDALSARGIDIATATNDEIAAALDATDGQQYNQDLTNADVEKFASALKESLGLETLSMFLSNGEIHLNLLVVPKDAQRQGAGTKAMEAITAFADMHGKRITLSPALKDDRKGTTSRSRLVKFYKRFGFVENKGRNKDFSISGGMYRDPVGSREMFQSAPLKTDTPEFRAWFGDSKVVDEDGNPLVVYHGTFTDFDAFSMEFAGRNTDTNATDDDLAQTARVGFWFSENDAVRELIRADKVVDAYLSIQRPHEVSLSDLASEISEAGSADAYRSALVDDRFDGLKVADEEFGGTSWVAFRPEQIKSVNNRGTFDPADPRILYQSQDTAVTLDLLAVERFDKAISLEPPVNGTRLSVQYLADILEGVPLLTKAESLGSIPSQSTVLSLMRGISENDAQILDAIIQLVPVDVVDNFFGSQGAAKVTLHDEAMLKDGSAFDAELSVPGGLGDASGAVRLFLFQEAIPATKAALVSLNARLEPAVRPAAPVAGQVNRLSQDDTSGKRASIVFPKDGITSGQSIITIFENGDLSSVIHESGHFFLESFNALASEEHAPQAMKDDLAAIFAWLGVKGWSEVGVPQHEQWARGFEAYVMEGKAPSLALADAFARFKAWLTRIYRTARGLKVNITPEIREVMDRMLATDAEIKAAREEQAMRPLFADAPPGMSQTDFTTYQRMARRAVDQAEQSLMARVMAKVRREREAWYRAEKKAVLAEVTADVERRREYRLVDLLANQVWHGAVDGAEIPDMQIDRKALVEQFGDGVLAEVSRQRFGGRRAIYGDNGAAPEEVAQFFGFASAAEMVRTLQNAPRKRDAIAAEVERRMVERHGDPLNDGTIEEDALAAIHSEQQANLSVTEARHMARRLGRDTAGMTAKIYRRRAREMVGRMMVRDVIRPERFLASERKAARAAQDAFARVARGTGAAEQALAEALQAKEQQILNGFIYDEARKVAEYVQKGREKMRAYAKKSVREKLDGGYIEQIDAILEDYDFRIRGQRQIARAESLKTFVDRMIEEGREGELNVDARLIDAVNRRHYTKLSVDELRGLFDTVANIDHMGRFKQRLADRKRKRELQASADRVSGLIRKNLGTGKAGVRHRIAEAFNLLWRTDTLLIRMDGGEELGGAYDEIKRSIDEATSEEHRMNVEMAERLDALFKSHYSAADIRRMKVEHDIPGANDRAWSKLEILAVALNTGNEDNYLRLTAPDAAMKNRLTKAQVDVLLATMDENDWRFVQAMWGMVDSYWSGLAEVAQRRTGVVPKKVEAKLMVGAPSFVTGGYYPIVYDPALSASAAADEASAWDKFTATGRGATAAIRNGMTKQRAKSGGGRTLRLDVSVAFAHMRDTIRYIALSEAVDNTYRLISHPDVQNAFLDAGAKDQHDILKLWLKDVAKGPSPSPDAFNTMFRIVKNNFTLSRLALNFKTVALQVTGVGQSAVVIGKRNMIRGYLEYLKSPRGTAAAVVARSVFMRERRATFQKDIHDFMDDTQLAGPVASGYKKGKAVVGKIGFAPIVWTQFWAVDMPTWLGAFRAGVEKFGDESKAAHYADRMVARSQDSGLMADRAAFERGTLSETTRQADVVRFFTTLGGYMLTKMNRGYVETMRARIGWRDADAGAQRVGVVLTAATNLALLYWTEAIITALLWSALGDDDDDDDLKGFLLRETGSAVVGGIPIIRDVYSALTGFGGGGIYGSVADAPARLLTQVAQGENDAALRRAIGDSVGMITGLPTTGPMRAIEGALSEDVPLSEALLGRNPLAR